MKNRLTAGGVEVDAAVPLLELCAALQDAGYVAAPLKHRPGGVDLRDLLRLFARTLLFALPAAIVGGLLGLAAIILLISSAPSCNSAGNESACAMAMPLYVVGFAVIGGSIAGLLTLARGSWRLYRKWERS